MTTAGGRRADRGGRPEAGHVTGTSGHIARARAAVACWIVATALAMIGVALLVATLSVDVSSVWAVRGFSIAIGLASATVGAVVIVRVPGNPIGWLFMVGGLLGSLQGAAEEYAVAGILAAPRSLPAPRLAAWLAGWIWIPAEAAMLAFLPLVFPSGRLPSRRWRPLAWFDAGCTLLAMLGAMFLPGRLDNSAYLDNPYVLLPAFPGDARWVAYLPLVAAIGAGGITLALAFRRSSGVLRQQLKWLAFSAAMAGAALTLIPFGQAGMGIVPGWTSRPAEILVVAGILGIPIAAGVAIVRYRLYDIDRIISRTVAYLLITGLLAGLFSLMVVLLQGLLAPFTESNALAVAGSTLVVAAAFQPLRRRIQAVVDRQFNRARIDAARAEAELAARIRDEVDADAVVGALVASTERTLQPAASGVWIRGTAG